MALIAPPATPGFCRMCVWMSVNFENFELLLQLLRLDLHLFRDKYPTQDPKNVGKIFGVGAPLWAGAPKRAKTSKLELLPQFFR